MLRNFLFVPFTLLLVACATQNQYTPPPMQPGVATVQSTFKRFGLMTWRKFTLLSIDNQPVASGLFDSFSKQIPVVPGKHSFVVQIEFNRGFADGPYESIVDMTAILQPGMRYETNGDVVGAKAVAWLQDIAGRRASTIGAESYRTVPTQVMVMPVVISH